MPSRQRDADLTNQAAVVKQGLLEKRVARVIQPANGLRALWPSMRYL